MYASRPQAVTGARANTRPTRAAALPGREATCQSTAADTARPTAWTAVANPAAQATAVSGQRRARPNSVRTAANSSMLSAYASRKKNVVGNRPNATSAQPVGAEGGRA